MGTCDQLRIRRHTSTPSMSGKPRSSMTISGAWVATELIACSPVIAVRTSYPRASSAALDQWEVRRDVDLYAHVGEEAAEAADALGDELVERDRLTLWLQRSGLDAAVAREVGDDSLEALGLVAHGRQQLGARGLFIRSS